MADSSFDIVSKVERQEVDNALNQAAKEISQRYDFKGVGASISWSGEKILMEANSEDRVKAILDVFQSKLIKRGISLKSLDAGEPQLSGKEYKIFASIEEGISQENAKKVAKIIRDEGPKGVRPRSRVTSSASALHRRGRLTPIALDATEAAEIGAGDVLPDRARPRAVRIQGIVELGGQRTQAW